MIAAPPAIQGYEGQMTYTTESAAIAAGDATIQSIAAETGWPIVDDCLVPEPGKWRAADESGCDITVEAGSGKEAAQEYIDGGEWGEITETTWITVRAWRQAIDSDGDVVRIEEDTHKITIEPTEPECEKDHEHDWRSPLSIVGGIKENPGVWGHGGGVTIQECCVRCGCGKLTDTWAQDPSDGEQGLTSVSYQPGKYSVA